jgi:ATP-binding cassette subfamily B protein
VTGRRDQAETARLKESDAEIFARLDSAVFRRFGRYLVPYVRAVSIATVAVVVFTLTSLAVPILVKVGLDDAIVPGNLPLLYVIAGALGAVAVLHWASMYVQRLIIQRVGQDVLYDIRRDMFVQLQRLSMSFTDRTPIGGLMSRVFGDVGALQEMLETTVEAMGDILLLFGIVVVMLVFDWRLGLMTLSVLPLLTLIRVFWQPFARRAFLRIRRNASIVGSYLDQNVSGIRVVQAMNREPVNRGIMGGKVSDLFWSNVSGSKLGAMLMPTVDLLTGVALAIVIIVGGSMVLGGGLEVGTMVLFLLFVQRFFEPIRSLTMHYSVLQRAVAAGHRIFELLDLPLEVADRPGAQPIGEVNPSVEFDHVVFGYDPAKPVIHDVSFRVEPGQTAAIVGPTGGGKTSLTALAHRFYDVQQGRVLIGGRDVRTVTQASLGSIMSMVLQEPFLFSKSVFENVRYNTRQATRADVERACRIIGAHDFIARLPEGYDTVLEQRGSNLSVGQRQLLSFARALVADPKILILDEATANIDSYTELIIQDALRKLLQGRTALVIAHRLSTIRNADTIIVVDRGRIVDRGTHDELVARGGLYAQLWRMNYASFDDLRGDLEKGVVAAASTT